jgi:hypothetical protein
MISSFKLLPIEDNFNIKVELTLIEGNKGIVFPPQIYSSQNPDEIMGSASLMSQRENSYIFLLDFFNKDYDKRDVLVVFPPLSIIYNNIPLLSPSSIEFSRPKRQLFIKLDNESDNNLDFNLFRSIILEIADPGVYSIPIVFDTTFCGYQLSSNLYFDEDNNKLYFFVGNKSSSIAYFKIKALPSSEALDKSVVVSFQPNGDLFLEEKTFTFHTKKESIKLDIVYPRIQRISENSASLISPFKTILNNLTNFIFRLKVASDDPFPFFEIIKGKSIFEVDEAGRVFFITKPSLGRYEPELRIKTRFDEELVLQIPILLLEPLSQLSTYVLEECETDIGYSIECFMEECYPVENECFEAVVPEKRFFRIGKKSNTLSFREVLIDILILIEFIVIGSISIDFKFSLTNETIEKLSLLLSGGFTLVDFENFLLTFGPINPSCLYSKKIKGLSDEFFYPLNNFYQSFLLDQSSNFSIKISHHIFGEIYILRT